VRISSISNSRVFVKLAIRFLIFIIIFGVLDFVIGSALKKMYFSIETGTSGAMINHLTQSKYDAYIMGASAAQHGYIPKVISDELGITVYNAGEDATSIFYKYAILQLILKHHKPKVIIWDVLDLDYFYYPEYAKTNFIKPYYEVPEIYEMLVELDRTNVALKLSRIYPYNHKIAAIVSELVSRKSSADYSQNGYLPVYGKFDDRRSSVYDHYVRDYFADIQRREANHTANDLLVRVYLGKFIELCQGNDIKIIAFTSPRCPANKDLASTPLISKELVEFMLSKGIIVRHITPNLNPELCRTDIFKDLGHLNHQGADLFSRIVAKEVKRVLSQKTQP
jgi:hypothetical protein